MSLRFRNRSNLYPLPRSWSAPAPYGRKFAWNSGTELFETYYARIAAYAANNGFTPPTAEEIEDHLCRQSSGRECTGEQSYHAAPRAVVSVGRSKSCKTCSGKKKP